MTLEDTKDTDTIVDKSFIDEQMNPLQMEEQEAKDGNMRRRIIIDILFLPEYYKHLMLSYQSRVALKSIKENLPSRFNQKVNFTSKSSL